MSNIDKASETNQYETEIPIKGMTCASCVGRIERAVQKVEGVNKVSVSLATEKAHWSAGTEASTFSLKK